MLGVGMASKASKAGWHVSKAGWHVSKAGWHVSKAGWHVSTAGWPCKAGWHVSKAGMHTMLSFFAPCRCIYPFTTNVLVSDGEVRVRLLMTLSCMVYAQAPP